MNPASDEDTNRLLDRLLETMTVLAHHIRGKYAADHDRREILEALDLAEQLIDQIHNGQTADDLISVVEALTDKLQLSINLLLSGSSENPGQPSARELHEEARVAFYTLRAHVFPDGKTWSS